MWLIEGFQMKTMILFGMVYIITSAVCIYLLVYRIAPILTHILAANGIKGL